MSKSRFENELDAALGTFVPWRLLLRLPQGAEWHGFNGGQANSQAQGTVVHEQCHFFQTIFTGYGQLSWIVQREITASVLEEWQQITATHSKKRLPLLHLRNRDPRTHRSVLPLQRLFSEMTSVRNARFWCGPHSRVRDLGCDSLKQSWNVAPKIMIAGKPHILQGKEVLESHAKYIESAYLDQVHQMPFDRGFDHRCATTQYTAAWDWFNEVCPGHANDFPFICDLALQLSCSTVESPKSEDQWRATHPAWRFVKLTLALQRLQIHVGEPRKAETWYDEYARVLLDDCNYRPLREVLEERRTAFVNKDLSPLAQLMFEALEFRLNKPWCGANVIADAALYEQVSTAFPMPIIQSGGELGGPSKSKSMLLDAFFELQYQALAEQVLGDLSSAQNSDGHVECAFARFGISQGCELQRDKGCTGRFLPSAGLPHLAESGCSFGVVVERMLKLNVKTLELVAVP
jgi:hypothetical protein